jgi:hypothetical protein
MKERALAFVLGWVALGFAAPAAADPWQISVQRARVYEGDGFAGWQAGIATGGDRFRWVAEGTVWGYDERNGLLLTTGPRLSASLGAHVRPFVQVTGGIVDNGVGADLAGGAVGLGVGVDVLATKRLGLRAQADLYKLTGSAGGELGRISAGLVIGLW